MQCVRLVLARLRYQLQLVEDRLVIRQAVACAESTERMLQT